MVRQTPAALGSVRHCPLPTGYPSDLREASSAGAAWRADHARRWS